MKLSFSKLDISSSVNMHQGAYLLCPNTERLLDGHRWVHDPKLKVGPR